MECCQVARPWDSKPWSSTRSATLRTLSFRPRLRCQPLPSGHRTFSRCEPPAPRRVQPQGLSAHASSHGVPDRPAAERQNLLAHAVTAFQQAFTSLEGMWGKFIPMATLFFLMAFVNTILDSLKDTLVITAVGGGANVIPWLTVYAVLPFSIAFLVAFNYLSAFMTREKLFNAIISAFLAFLLFFAFVMYPNHGVLHPTATADFWAQQVPKGFAGLIGMVRNWTFTVFYCISEMWGDVGLSLLFWGLANETTKIQDAPTLYPLFGIGANVAQVLAGRCLRTLAASLGGTHEAFVSQVQYISVLMVAMCLGILALHHYITREHHAALAEAEALAQQRHSRDGRHAVSSSPRGNGAAPNAASKRAVGHKNGAAASPSRGPPHVKAESAQLAVHASSNSAGAEAVHGANGAANGARWESTVDPSRGGEACSRPGADPASAPTGERAAPRAGSAEPGGGNNERVASSREAGSSGRDDGASLSFVQALRYCWQTSTIRWLATMAIAQGLCSNLAEFAWKHHLRLLHPTPQGFSGYMGDVASWTGVLTVLMMFAAPTAFKTLGWRRTARATPDFLLVCGGAFFAACAVYQVSGAFVGAAVKHMMLRALVVAGAALYIISRSAKFSLFKPAEEMVYISLDQRARLNGKATVDVFGAQFGKSSGSIMQQALLLATAGSLLHSLPVMALVFAFIAFKWGKSVDELSRIAHTHTSLESVDFDDHDYETTDDEFFDSGRLHRALDLEPVQT